MPLDPLETNERRRKEDALYNVAKALFAEDKSRWIIVIQHPDGETIALDDTRFAGDPPPFMQKIIEIWNEEYERHLNQKLL